MKFAVGMIAAVLLTFAAAPSYAEIFSRNGGRLTSGNFDVDIESMVERLPRSDTRVLKLHQRIKALHVGGWEEAVAEDAYLYTIKVTNYGDLRAKVLFSNDSTHAGNTTALYQALGSFDVELEPRTKLQLQFVANGTPIETRVREVFGVYEPSPVFDDPTEPGWIFGLSSADNFWLPGFFSLPIRTSKTVGPVN